jgi:hypothetical protein
MARYSLIEAPTEKREEFVKAVNEMLDSGWQVHGGTLVVFDSEQKKHILYQAFVKE